ncbi:phosphopyruvate hydratase [Beutenbergia cavernae]|nr:phosphopyruvate hydratase [Beutenbergia cavernae]
MSIRTVTAWEALDSRGRPTVACRVDLADGARAVARVPSGASTGSHEAPELRDGGTRYGGFGVRTAVAGLRDHLAPAVVGLPADETAAVDRALADAYARHGQQEVGANATLAVSLAALLAAAASRDEPLARMLHPEGPLPLPMPMVNIVSGGAHAAGAIDIQDVLVIPEGASTFAEAVEWAARVRAAAAAVASGRGFAEAALVADEGGLGLRLGTNEAALQLVAEAVDAAGLGLGTDVTIAIDAAATEFASDGRYALAAEDRALSAEEMVELYAEWVARYPIRSIEDPLAEDDWDGWALATRELGGRIDLVGDDLFVTQSDRLQRGIAEGCATSILVKVNQNGLVSRAGDVLRAARAAGYRTVVSARSGETEDSWVADLAVGWSAGQLKVGSTQRSERTAKWNRVLELEATESTELQHPWPSRTEETAS